MNALADFSIRHKRLHPRLKEAIIPCLPDHTWVSLIHSTPVSITNPFWRSIRKVWGWVALDGTFFVAKDRVHMFDLKGTHAIVRLAGLAHEIYHSIELRKVGRLTAIRWYISGVIRSLFHGDSYYDHSQIPYEQRAIDFGHKVAAHFDLDSAKVEKFFEGFV